MINKIIFTSILSLLLFSSCRKTDQVIIGSISLDEYTSTHDMTIGDALEKELNSFITTLSPDDAPEAYAYLQSMFDLVLTTPAFTKREEYNWKVSIIFDDDQSTAFALPNGHLYIYSGLLKYLETESQLISLLAHELTYVEKGYATALLDSEFGGQELGDIILDNEQADPAKMAEAFPRLSYTEEKVRDADEFSVEVLCPFVYEPRGIVKVIEKVMENPQIRPDWFEMRPSDNFAQRVQRINSMSDPCGLDGVKNRAEYTAFLATF